MNQLETVFYAGNILKPGAGVVTTRAHVHYVVTEYGIADLYRKNMHQRAEALIELYTDAE